MCALRGLARLQCPQLQELNLFGNRNLDTAGQPHDAELVSRVECSYAIAQFANLSKIFTPEGTPHEQVFNCHSECHRTRALSLRCPQASQWQAVPPAARINLSVPRRP